MLAITASTTSTPSASTGLSPTDARTALTVSSSVAGVLESGIDDGRSCAGQLIEKLNRTECQRRPTPGDNVTQEVSMKVSITILAAILALTTVVLTNHSALAKGGVVCQKKPSFADGYGITMPKARAACTGFFRKRAKPNSGICMPD